MSNIKPRNDYRLSEVFIEENRDKTRFLYEHGHWLVFKDGKWTEDNSGEIVRLAKQTIDKAIDICLEKYKKTDDLEYKSLANFYLKNTTHRAVQSMLALSKSDLTINTSNLNKDHSLLNLSNGTFDLALKKFRPHHPDDLLTCQMNVEYRENAKSTSWLEFIELVTQFDPDFANYLQKAVGSCLVGNNEEQFFLIHGPTRTGKSTFIEPILHIFGDYGKKTDFSTFLDKKDTNIRNDIARLMGARIVVSNEMEKGQKLNASLIKSITGRDKMVARFLHKEYFEFDVTFKVWLATNDFPKVDSEDDAIWRRVIKLPFIHQIKDPNSKIKETFFKDEETKSGILNWVLEGYYKYKQEGLTSPDIILNSNAHYRLSQTSIPNISKFISEWCHIAQDFRIERATLWNAYQQFMYKSLPGIKSENFLGRTEFYSQVNKSGFDIVTIKGNKYFKGIHVISDEFNRDEDN